MKTTFLIPPLILRKRILTCRTNRSRTNFYPVVRWIVDCFLWLSVRGVGGGPIATDDVVLCRCEWLTALLNGFRTKNVRRSIVGMNLFTFACGCIFLGPGERHDFVWLLFGCFLIQTNGSKEERFKFINSKIRFANRQEFSGIKSVGECQFITEPILTFYKTCYKCLALLCASHPNYERPHYGTGEVTHIARSELSSLNLSDLHRPLRR